MRQQKPTGNHRQRLGRCCDRRCRRHSRRRLRQRHDQCSQQSKTANILCLPGLLPPFQKPTGAGRRSTNIRKAKQSHQHRMCTHACSLHIAADHRYQIRRCLYKCIQRHLRSAFCALHGLYECESKQAQESSTRDNRRYA